MNYSVMTERETEIELNTSVSEGLTSFTAHDILLEKGRNLPEKEYSRGVFNLALSQFKNLYTIAFFVMGIITAVLDFNGSTGAWMIFFAVAVLNMVSGFLRDNKARRDAVNFDMRRKGEVKVIRDGKIVLVDPTLLVAGDIVVLEKGDFVPADLRILECENLKADEVIFGESSVPVSKQSEKVDDEFASLRFANILYTGSSIAEGSGKGAVIATGKNTLIARLHRSRKRRVKINKKFAKSARSEKVLVSGAVLCAIFVFLYVSLTSNDVKKALLLACTISLCLLPAPIAMIRWLTVKFFARKIKQSGTEFANNDKIDLLSEIDYLLFDKGGVLTSGKMEVEQTLLSDNEKFEMAVLCSDCDFKRGKAVGNEIDTATVQEAILRGIDAEKLVKNTEKILYMPFDETRKFMAVLVEKEEGYRLIVKGAVDVVPTLCDYITDGNEKIEMTGEILHKLENASSAMAEKGLKIRALAYRDIDFIPENIEDEIKSMIFAGEIGFREVIVKKAKEAVRNLENMYVRCIMVTGDNTITAAAQAKLAGIIKREDECISFREIGECSDKELAQMAEKYKVFTSATGDDRARLVRALGRNNHSVAVAGEQMTEESVALSASCSVTDGKRYKSDVIVKEENITVLSETVCTARAMRGNMAYASLMGISVGTAEAMLLLWMLLFKESFTATAFGMLSLNMFVVCVPSLILSLFARVRESRAEGRLLSIRCAMQAVICALFALGASENFMMYFLFYSLLDAGRVCASFKNLEKGKPGGKGLILVLIVTFIAIVLAKFPPFGLLTNDYLATSVLFAIIAVAINALLSKIRLKGFGAKNV